MTKLVELFGGRKNVHYAILQKSCDHMDHMAVFYIG